MTQYMLVLRDDPSTYKDFSPEQFQKLIEAYNGWAGMLAEQGRLVVGHKLTETGGKVLSKAGGRLTVKDGPFGETKEVVGGYYIVKADGYEHAVALCKEHPAFLTAGTVEIREVDFMGQPES